MPEESLASLQLGTQIVVCITFVKHQPVLDIFDFMIVCHIICKLLQALFVFKFVFDILKSCLHDHSASRDRI